MQKSMKLDHLALAERHVVEGEQRLNEQRELIDRLKQGGHDVAEAELILRTFEKTQSIHIADRARLREELKKPD